MDQEREDYVDQPIRPRRPWSLLEIAIVILIVLLSLPLFAVVLCVALIVLLGGFQN